MVDKKQIAAAFGAALALPRDSYLRADEERAAIELLRVMPGARQALAMEEVERRAELFERTYKETPYGSTSKTFRTAAYESVRDDIINGRWL